MTTLCKRQLVEERRINNGAPEWRRDEERGSLGLFVTDAGLLTLGMDNTETTKSPPAAANMPRQRKTGVAKPRGREKKVSSSAPNAARST